MFIGAFAINPTNDARIPIFIADYVLMGYGTGAIMAVPAHDERDFEFAREFDLPIVPVIRPSDEWLAEHDAEPTDATTWPEAYVGDGVAQSSANDEVSLDGLHVDEAKRVDHRMAGALRARASRPSRTSSATGCSAGSATGASRSRSSTTTRGPIALPETMLPVVLPDVTDFEPVTSDDPDALPEPPLARAVDWVEVELDLRGRSGRATATGRQVYLRETNTMPQWAGSCWYYLRYLDPTNEDAMVDPAVEQTWAEGARARRLAEDRPRRPVRRRRRARGAAPAVRALLAQGAVRPRSRRRRPNRSSGSSTRATSSRPRTSTSAASYVDADRVEERDGEYFFEGKPVTREFGKMGKSLRNAVAPDDICRDYGADTLRLYEMFMGPLDKERPWSTADIVGVHRFLQRLWRNFVDEDTGASRVADVPADDDDPATACTARSTRCATDMTELSFNTAIARLFELNNHLTPVVQRGAALPREVAVPLVLMVAPLAPHIAEELWLRLGNNDTLAYEPFPVADPQWLVDDTVEVPVQINGKVRARVEVAVGADAAAHEAAARAEPRIAELLDGATVRNLKVVPGKIVNFVLA